MLGLENEPSRAKGITAGFWGACAISPWHPQETGRARDRTSPSRRYMASGEDPALPVFLWLGSWVHKGRSSTPTQTHWVPYVPTDGQGRWLQIPPYDVIPSDPTAEFPGSVTGFCVLWSMWVAWSPCFLITSLDLCFSPEDEGSGGPCVLVLSHNPGDSRGGHTRLCIHLPSAKGIRT